MSEVIVDHNTRAFDSVGDAMSDEYIIQQIPRFRWFVHTAFGNGIVARSTSWPDAPADSRHMGASKFDFIVRPHLGDLQGKRILELGCNAGVISIHMARLGAAEVVGVDCDRTWKGWLAQAELVKRALEWRCKTRYNVVYLESAIENLPERDLGRFDYVVALNCLYYLPEEQIQRVVRHFATISDSLIVQCNTRDHSYLGRRPHPGFMRSVLKENGFPRVRIVWPWDHPWKGVWPQRYSRPLVIGATH